MLGDRGPTDSRASEAIALLKCHDKQTTVLIRVLFIGLILAINIMYAYELVCYIRARSYMCESCVVHKYITVLLLLLEYDVYNVRILYA